MNYSFIADIVGLCADDVEKKYKYIKEAEELNIQVLPVTFITECQNGGNALQLIDSMNLVSWGSDVSLFMLRKSLCWCVFILVIIMVLTTYSFYYL